MRAATESAAILSEAREKSRLATEEARKSATHIIAEARKAAATIDAETTRARQRLEAINKVVRDREQQLTGGPGGGCEFDAMKRILRLVRCWLFHLRTRKFP